MNATFVIDLQNDFFRDGPLLKNKPIIKNSINKFTQQLRYHSSLICWVETKFKEDGSNIPHHMKMRNTKILVEGSKGASSIDGLIIKDCDRNFIKHTWSVFKSNEIKLFLNNYDIKSVKLLGINTHECILFSAIDLYQEGYDVHVPSNAVWSYDKNAHRYSLDYLSKRIQSVKNL